LEEQATARDDAPAITVSGEDSERARAAAVTVLRRARRIVLTSHERTDADGAGSALGLVIAMRGVGLDARAAFPSPLPGNLAFLPGAAEAAIVEPGRDLPEALRGADCVLSLDAGSASRLGGLRALGERASAFLNVDHHASNDGFGTQRWVDPSYAATGIMAFELACELGAPLARDACLCFYTAIVFDTGGFAFSNTDPRTHRVAAACLERGVRAEEVTRRLHRARSLSSWKFHADAVAGLRTSPDGTIAWIAVPRSTFDRHALRDDQAPELVEVPVSLAATRIAFVLTELAGGAGVRVSLRSRCPIGVHHLAARHGGGGHARAAGMTIPGALADAERVVLDGVRGELTRWAARHGGQLPPQDA
jgi:phosphoesterase RecJ-like protein